MKSALFAVTILLMVVTGTLGGRITPWGDIEVYNPNKGYITYLDLYTTFDSKLPIGHLLRITLPFSTAPSISTVIVYSGATSKASFFATPATPTGTLYATGTSANTSSSTPFNYYYTFNADLQSSTNYVIRITFSTSPTDVGFLGYIQLETLSPALSIISTGSDLAISYDLNNAFAALHIAAIPGNLTLTTTADSNATSVGVSSLRQFKISPSQNFYYWPTIVLSWSNSNFTLSNLVSIDTGVSTSTLTPLTLASSGATTSGQYSYSTSGTSLVILHNALLTANTAITYNVTVANPSTTNTAIFSVKIYHRYNYNLTDVTATTQSVTVTGGSVTSSTLGIVSQQILLSWGLDRNSSTVLGSPALQRVFQIYTSSIANPQYQAINFVFGISGTLISASLYRVTVGVCGVIAACDVLENSIVSNITGASCSLTYGTSLSIYCNVTAIATTGNAIAARIFLSGAATGGTSVMTGTYAAGYSINDTTFGVIGINTVTTATSGATVVTSLVNSSQASSPYMTSTFSTAPLVNINNNGPMTMMPISGSPPGASTNTISSYSTLWQTPVGPSSYTAVTSPTTGNTYAQWPGTIPAITTTGGSVMGGIYTSTTSGLKYNVALVTQAQMFVASGSYSTFSSVASTATTATTILGVPGLDLFLNPNLFSSAGSTQNPITDCYANNLAVRNPPNWYSGGTDAAGTTGVAQCFTNYVSSFYLRLRFLFTTRANTGGISSSTSATTAASIDSVLTGGATALRFMSFFWESALIISNAYSGSSIRADTNIPDFYGLFYILTFTTPATQNPPATSSATSATDLGELSSGITNLASSGGLNLGTPIFWNQMLMGPYGTYVSGSTTNYYNSKTVFISNYDAQTTTADTYTSNNFVSLLRVRGLFQTSSSGVDSGLVPSGGRLALFIQIPNLQTQFEGLGGAGFTTAGTINTYQGSTTVVLGTVPLVGNGVVRCWSTSQYQNCTLDRRGRALPTAISTGIISPIDLYQIFTSDVTYSTNFSSVIVLKPKMATVANYQTYLYRLGFQSTSTYAYYIQTWDQIFDNGASTTAATGVAVQSVTPFTATTIVGAPYTTATACTIPFSTSSATAPSIRLMPGTTETDNTLLSSTTTLAINAYATAVAPSKLQGAITWCAQWNFRASSTFSISTQSSLESTSLGDKCIGFDYLAENTTNYYCIYCPISASSSVPAQSSAASPISLSITGFTTGTAANILTGTFATLATDIGSLQDLGQCLTISGPGSATNPTNPYVWLPNLITGVSGSGSAFNLQGQKITVSFTAPSTIATGIVDTITVTGRNTTGSSPDTNFPYGTQDTNAVCRLVPSSNPTNYTQYQTCGISISGGIITVTPATIGSAYASVTSWTLIIWGINGNTSVANSPTSTNFYVQTLKSSTLVDSSNTTNSVLPSWSLNTAPVLNFTTANVGYQRQIIGARGYFRFDFIFSSLNWYYNDKVVFSVDGIVTTTSNNLTSVVKCRITDTSDNLLQGFQSCTLVSSTSPATLTIIALPPTYATGSFDFSAANGFRVYLDNMVTIAAQTNKVIYGTIYFSIGTNPSLVKNTTGTDIASQALTTAQTMTTPVLTKYFAAANDYQDMAFLLTTASAFTSAGRITIAFPSYYLPYLTTRKNGVYCTINNVYTMCAIGSNSSTASIVGIRTLAIYGYSGSFAAGASFVVKVNGIRAPPASYALEPFYVQINTDNAEDIANISSAAAFNDTAYSAQTVVPLNVNWFTIGTSLTRTTTTFTWTFGLNSTTNASTTQAISAYFPESWGVAWGIFTPTCTVIDATNTSLTYASAQTIFGNLVQLNISTAIPNAAVVTLSCMNVRTTDNNGFWESNSDIVIRVTDANGTSVYQRNAPGMDNINYAYSFAATNLYLSWNITGSLTTPAALTAGTYSLPLALSITSAASSNRTFSITPSNSNFAFLSSTAPFYLATGAVSNSTLLGCASSVPVGVYALTFTISDTTIYTAPPRLWISVNNNAQIITPSATTVTTYYESTTTTSSYAPLVFDTTLMPPYSDITITPVAPTGNTNFTFTPASIKLTTASPKNYFIFSTTSATASASATATYTFTITGTNAASYTISSGVTFALTADSTSSNTASPVVTVAADSTDTSSPIAKILTLTLTGVTQATIYWAVALQGQALTDPNAIQSLAGALTSYNANSANQAQYGTFYQVASPSKSPSNFQVMGLYANTGYTISVVAVSLANKTSTVAQYTFVTGSNGASIQRWLFNYTTYPSQAQRQTLLCTITQMIAVPAMNVRDANGEICGNTTAFYNVSNSSGDIGVYFYPLQVATDTVIPNLATNLNTTAKINTLNTTIGSGTSGLGFLNVVPDGTIANTMPTATFPSSATVGQTWAQFSGLSLNSTGFVFLAIGSNTTSAPTAVVFKQAAAGILSNTSLSQIQVIYYYPAGGSLSYNFTGLSAATTYNAYLLASNNDPSFLQNFTSVSTIAFTTSSIGSTTGSPIGVVLSVMAIFASVISLLFI